MVITSKRGNLDNVVTFEHMCDTKEDMKNINSRQITIGSVCIVVKGEGDGLEVYMADSDKVWHPIVIGSGESGEHIDLDEIIINENGEYIAEEGKGYNKIIVETPEDKSKELIIRTISSINNNTIDTIGQGAFAYCYNLTEASFPNCSLIKNSAFTHCSNLMNISFPNCENIGEQAFLSCIDLISINFPKCEKIGPGAFQNCINLASINFPNCTYIDRGAFVGCSELKNIHFPNCSNIGQSAFSICFGLTSVNFPSCKYINSYAFAYCNNLKNINFPECSNIGSSAFFRCEALETISFPKCNYIWKNAFQLCSNLTSIYILNSSICALENSNAFMDTKITNSSGSIFVPASLVNQYKLESNWSYFSNRITAYIEP